MLLDCTNCDGFIPPHHERCPHCDASSTSRRVSGKAVKVAGCAVAMMTLMACYGGGYDGYSGESDPELAVQRACAGVFTIDSSGTASGDLSNGRSTVMEGNCMPGVGNENILRFSDSSVGNVPGTLTVSWTSDNPVGVYLLDDCLQGSGSTNELSCSPPATSGLITIDGFYNREVDIVVDTVPGVALGSYQLQVVFEADAGCGNKVIEGDEECDDGNVTDGDGCSSTCTEEAPAACQLAQELQLGANVGDTTALESNSNGQACLGPDKLYQYTATSAGTLTVVLDATTDMSLKLMGACTAQSLAADCVDTQPAGTPEVLSRYLLVGDTVFVVVDAVDVTSGGLFSLDAAFVPDP
jgi:cysteine-rich repeat protein